MAYAAAGSLLQILERLRASDQSSNIESQIQLLYDQVRFLKYFLKENSQFQSNFESQIRDAIYEAEDIVEYYVSSQFLSSEVETVVFSQNLQRVMLKIMFSTAEGMEKFTNHDSGPKINTSLQKGHSRGSLSTSPVEESPFFGRKKDMIQLMNRLKGVSIRLEVVAVFGIPGIGKTTLAQHVYSDPDMKHHFDIRAWVTLSPEYEKRDVLLELLRSMEKLSDEMSSKTDDQLANHVIKYLNGKRYLVVLDDVNDIEVWKEFKELLTDDNKGSRVMLTTRNGELADFAVRNGPFHERDMNGLMDRLTGSASGLEVVAAAAISEISKTTLAQNVYGDPSMVSRFNIRAWVKLSPQYLKQDVLLALLRSMKKLSHEKMTYEQLAEHVIKRLSSRRYLVVLNTVRAIEVWKELKELFTDDNNGSRVMLLTQNMEIADSAVGKENAYNQDKGQSDEVHNAERKKLKEKLFGSASGLEVIEEPGVRGISKTLAEEVYRDHSVVYYFDIRAWVTLSPKYQKRDVLLELLHSMEKLSHEKMNYDQLAKHVTKRLTCGRYLVVLDDLHDIKVWDELKEIIRDDNNGSRVMIITENMRVARLRNEHLHELASLSGGDSRALLCKIVFGEESSPPEQKEITTDIAVNCMGLPLAIVTIGRLMSWISNKEWWTVVSSIGNCSNHDELMEAVVSLSYKYLPQNLKACLLYLGLFPYSHEIPVSKLIKLWVAEGFIESTLHGSLEEMAEDYLLQLAKRNLVLVCRTRFNGKIRTCRINQVFRDFIVRKAEEEKFSSVISKNPKGFPEDTNNQRQKGSPEDTNNQRRLCIHKNISFGIIDVSKYISHASALRSLLFTGPQNQYALRVCSDFKMLRVLDALKIRFYAFPSEILKLVCLRYLALSYNGELPASLCKLLNLQFLIVLRYLSMKHSGTPLYLPMEIWNMKALRHLQFLGNDLPAPSTAASENDDGMDNHLILENLLTLADVSAHSCTPQILKRIPNLKKLGILIGSSSPDQDAAEAFSFLNHLHILSRLESFKCVMHPDHGPDLGSPGTGFPIVSSFNFPSTLRKITLSGCGFPWKHMTVIGSLPYLEVLKLQSYAFQGPEWETFEEQFCRLKFLLLEDMDVRCWTTEYTHFPSLMHLIIRHCYNLEVIPLEIGDISTLERIELVDCSPSAMKSALLIQEEQLYLGNEHLQFNLHSTWDD